MADIEERTFGESEVAAVGPKRRKSWRRRLTAISCGMALALLLGEILLRMAGIAYPAFFEEDDLLGRRMIPGAEGIYAVEGRSRVKINRAGWRDLERTERKPAGTLRIAVIGDSFAVGREVEFDRTFCRVAQAQLDRQDRTPTGPVEIMNFACAGYGTAQELLVVRHRVWRYAPDVVILAFFCGNDVANNSPELDRGLRPYFLLKEGEMLLDDSFKTKLGRKGAKQAIKAWIAERSRIWQVCAHLRNVLDTRRRQAEGGLRFGNGSDPKIYSEPVTQAWRDAWTVTERLLGTMADECRPHGARFGVMTLTTCEQVLPDAVRRKRVAADLGVPDLLYSDRRVAATCSRIDVPYLMLAPRLQEAAERDGIHLHGFASNSRLDSGHWNEHGHRLAGEELARWIVEEFLRAR